MTAQQNTIHFLQLQDYRNEQNKLKEIKEKLLTSCQLLEQKIAKQLQKIKQTSNTICQGAKLQTQIYCQSLDSESYSTSVIDLATLSNYLKREKSYLINLVSSEEPEAPKSGKELLHNLCNRKKFEKYLRNLQCLKIQKEIEYLEKNILVGKNKKAYQNIIYEDIESVTIREENEQIQKIKLLLEELQRIVSLSNQCAGYTDNQVSKKSLQLTKQTERLQTIEKILDRQTKEIVQVKNFFKDYDPKQIFDYLGKEIQEIQNYTVQAQIHNPNYLDTLINASELYFLMNFNCETSNTKIYKKPFEEVQHLIKTTKAKLKKIKV